jgi:hypothetical protein
MNRETVLAESSPGRENDEFESFKNSEIEIRFEAGLAYKKTGPPSL